MTSTRQDLGRWGETLAADYLAQKGYTVIDRNVRTYYGEIDLITQQQGALVFVEVKTRSSDVYGPPEASVTARKREHLIAAAQAYLQKYPNPNIEWRIDVIAIRKLKSSNQPEIVHFENAIT